MVGIMHHALNERMFVVILSAKRLSLSTQFSRRAVALFLVGRILVSQLSHNRLL